MEGMPDIEGPLRRPVTSIALWRGDRRPAQVVQESPVEQDLQRGRQQDTSRSLAFDAEYSLWLEEHNKHIYELRTAVNSHASDSELRIIVDNVIVHYDELFRAKENAAKEDALHVLLGMWKTPVERYFMWAGGFRTSELLKIPAYQEEPLTEQQLLAIHHLQLSCLYAEDALSQGMEALQESLAETLANESPATEGSSGDYMGQMAMAMRKLGVLEGFLRQILDTQLEPLSVQQLAAIYCLQLSSLNAEDALSQGMEALQQSLRELLANGSVATERLVRGCCYFYVSNSNGNGEIRSSKKFCVS